MTVNLIMAADNAGGIGLGGEMPWHDPEDLRWFKKMTMGGIIIVGHNTAQKLPELLGRIVIVPTRDDTAEGLIHSCQDNYIEKDIWIAGGAKTYQMFLPYVHRFYISRIFGNFPVDTFSPFNLPWKNSNN